MLEFRVVCWSFTAAGLPGGNLRMEMEVAGGLRRSRSRQTKGATLLTLIAPFVNIQFLGTSLAFMMVYVWGRRHQHVQMSFLGLFNFTAPYLPWVLLIFSVMLGSSPLVDLLGMVVGHIYFFFEDVYPVVSGRRLLRTPGVIKALFPDDS